MPRLEAENDLLRFCQRRRKLLWNALTCKNERWNCGDGTCGWGGSGTSLSSFASLFPSLISSLFPSLFPSGWGWLTKMSATVRRRFMIRPLFMRRPSKVKFLLTTILPLPGKFASATIAKSRRLPRVTLSAEKNDFNVTLFYIKTVLI